jgi:hypothetical protein
MAEYSKLSTDQQLVFFKKTFLPLLER